MVARSAFIALLAFAPALIGAGAAQAKEQSRVTEAEYLVTWMGLPVYSARLRGEVGGRHYAVRFSAAAEGIARLANNTTIAWETSGSTGAAGLRPTFFAQSNTFRKQVRRIELRYGERPEPAVSVVPPESPGKRPPVPEALQHGTVDPLTAVLAAVTSPADHSVCAVNARVFEGLRRTDVRLEAGGTEAMPALGLGGMPNDALICLLHAERLAGYEHKHLRDNPDPLPPAKLWIAHLPEAGLWLPVQLRFESRFGPIYARLVRLAHRNGPAP